MPIPEYTRRAQKAYYERNREKIIARQVAYAKRKRAEKKLAQEGQDKMALLKPILQIIANN